MKRKTVGLAMFAAAMLGLAASAGAVDGTIDINMAVVNEGGSASPCGSTAGFPCTISVSGSYRLSGNLTVPASKDGIDVTANNVTIDLNGFSITAPGSSSTTPLGINATNQAIVTIENGSVIGFGTGVMTGVFCIVRNLHADGNGSGINVGQASLVEGCTANNAINGIVAGNNSRIHGCTINNAPPAGIDAISCGSACAISENTVNGFESNGIASTAGSVISGNTVGSNAVGIACSASGCLISGNTIGGNTTEGIFANDATTGYGGNVLNGNTTSVSGGHSLGGNLCNGTAC
jgi:parallel beta-helix repeat protein